MNEAMTTSDTVVIGGDIKVGRVGLGAMRLTGDNLWGPYPDQDAAVQFLRDAVDAGVTLIDTADVYGPHTNEQLIHDALFPYPPGLVIASKGGLVRGGRELVLDAIGNPVYLRQAAHLTARRLGVERIDLYYLHTGRATDATFEKQVETLARLRDEGLIRHIGLSNVTVDQFKQAREITQIAAITAHFNVVDRSNEPLLRDAEVNGAIFVPWQPVSLLPPGVQTDVKGTNEVRTVMERIASLHDATPSQISLAWLLKQSPVMLPVPGTTNLRHLRENLASRDINLTTDELDEIGSFTQS